MNNFNDFILKLVIFTVISALIIANPLVLGWTAVWPPLLGIYMLCLGALIVALLILNLYQKRKDMINKKSH